MPPERSSGAATDDRSLLADPARQSPLAFVFIAWRFVRRLGFSALAAAFFFVVNGGLARGVLVAAVVVAIFLLISSTLSWWRFTFAVTGDELVVTRGVLAVDRLVIPLDRVQSVSTDQRLFHRPFGLVRVAVDTAGSATTELEIDALDQRRATALRRVVTDARDAKLRSVGSPDDGPAALVHDRIGVDDDEGRVLIHRSPLELVRIGVAKLPLAGLAVLAPLAAFGDEIGVLSGLTDQVGRSVDEIAEIQDGPVVISIVVGLALVVLLMGAVLQIVRELVVHFDLTLRRTPTGLRRTAGLLNKQSRSTTVRRVQIVTTDDWWLQRRLGITDLTLRTFGGANLDVPGTTGRERDEIRSLVLGSRERSEPRRPISGWSVVVAVRARALLAAAIALAGWFAVGWWSLLALAWVPVSIPIAVLRWRSRRWQLDDHSLRERYGIVWRHTGELAPHKAQVVTVSQSLFQRRRGLATLTVSTAGGSLSVPFVELRTAAAARDLVVSCAETDRRKVL